MDAMHRPDATQRLRRLLDDRRIRYDAVSDTMTYVYLPDRSVGYFSAAEGPSQSIHARVVHLERPGEWNPPRHTTWLSPEQAILATIDGTMPEDDPRNYVPVAEDDPRHGYVACVPKVPNLTVGADPDWVDWVASLRHDEPKDLMEAVEQIAYDAICFGGDMGPNDCGGECCPDEGMVWTRDIIDGWVRMVRDAVGRDVSDGNESPQDENEERDML